MNDMQKNLISHDLENFYYWKLVAERELLEGEVRDLLAVNFMTERWHNIAMMLITTGLPEDWAELCTKAQEAAQVRFNKESNE